MSVNITPHLNFRGQAREALEFYQTVFGGNLVLVTYANFHQAQAPDEEQQIIWGQVEAENGFRIMAFDALERLLPFERGQNSFYVAARFSTAEEASARWAKLSDGAAIRVPLNPAPWSPMYGMLQDRFGIVWVVDVNTESHA